MKPNSYEMIIWWSAEDDAYVVDVPELPFVASQATQVPDRGGEGELSSVGW